VVLCPTNEAANVSNKNPSLLQLDAGTPAPATGCSIDSMNCPARGSDKIRRSLGPSSKCLSLGAGTFSGPPFSSWVQTRTSVTRKHIPRVLQATLILWNFFDGRFDGYWIRNGNEPRNKDNTYGRAVRYWSGIRNRATELLGRDAVSGVDYALSAIVHCKSEGEQGEAEALSKCADRYLLRLLPALVPSSWCLSATRFSNIGIR
jgi:hypothetical protein